MKKLTIGVAAVILMALAGAAQAQAANKVEGKWKTLTAQDGKDLILTIEFGATGGYTATITDLQGGTLGSIEGTYSYSFGSLTISYPSGKTESYDVTWLGDDSFLNGTDLFTRVK